MQYTRLGDSGLIVSRLAFGTMTFGVVDGDWASVAKVDATLAKRLVDRSIEGGINFFDTADAYSGGQSEEMLGKALGDKRKDVVIATKVGFRYQDGLNNAGLSYRYIMQSAENSLRRLNTDYIDVYLVHRPDRFTPMDETLRALDDLTRRGMVRYVGFSNWPAWKAATAVGLQTQHNYARFIAAQMYYSLMGRDLEHGYNDFLAHAGIGTMIWSPLVGGFLTGKYTRDSVAATENDRMNDPGNEFIPFDQSHGFDVVDKLMEIADAHGASVPQVALSWTLAQPVTSTIIIGASKMHQLDDNLGAVDLKLSDDELADLNALTAPREIYPQWFNARTPDGPTVEALSSTN